MVNNDMKPKILSHPLVVAICLLFVTLQANAFYDPSVGRWLGRDPLGEQGGLNLYGFCHNFCFNAYDRDGKDYAVIKVEGVCGVQHRVVIGDDGSGNSYSFEMYPNVKSFWENYRRFSGEGVIKSSFLRRAMENWISGVGIIGVEHRVKTTPEQDELLAEAAQRLDSTGFWYFLMIQDCTSAEDRLNEEVRGTSGIGRFFNRILTAIGESLDAMDFD